MRCVTNGEVDRFSYNITKLILLLIVIKSKGDINADEICEDSKRGLDYVSL